MRMPWPFGLHFLVFAGHALVGPFFVVYYQNLGFSGTQIGLTPLITLIGAPLWTRLADRTLKHRWINGLALVVGVAALSAFPLLRAFVPILALAVLLSVFMSCVMPFTDGAAMHMLGERKELYGRLRLGGTIGCGLAAAITGALVQAHGLEFTFRICAGLFLLALFVSRRLVYAPSRTDNPPSGGFRQLLSGPR